MIEDLKSFYSTYFTAGDRGVAKRTLESFSTEMRRRDALGIALTSGGTIIMLFILAFFIFCPSTDGKEHYRDWLTSFCVTRFTLMLIYLLFASAICIKLFQIHEINYLYIFEIDPHQKMTSDQLFRVSSILFFVWTACCALTVA